MFKIAGTVTRSCFFNSMCRYCLFILYLFTSWQLPAAAQEASIDLRLSGFGKQVSAQMRSYLGDQVAMDSSRSQDLHLRFHLGGGDRYTLQVNGDPGVKNVDLFLLPGHYQISWNGQDQFPVFDTVSLLDSSATRSEQNARALAIDFNRFFALARRSHLSDSIAEQFIVAFPNHPISTFILDHWILKGQTETDWRHIAALYRTLGQGAIDNILAIRLAIAIEQHNTIPPGSMAPDFKMTDLKGHTYQLSHFRGKFVFLEFWASWCLPCRNENKALNRFLRKSKHDRLQVLGISLDQIKEDAKLAVKKDSANWLQLWDGHFIHTRAAILYEVQYIPSNFLIDPYGVICARNLYGDALFQRLRKIK